MFQNIIVIQNAFRSMDLKQPIYSLSLTQYIWLASATMAIVYNTVLWRDIGERLSSSFFGNALILLAIYLFVTIILALVLTIFSGRRFLKPLVTVLIVISCTTSWFLSIGIPVDKMMIANIVETNAIEASELLSLSLVFHIFAFGFVPAILFSSIEVRREGRYSPYLKTIFSVFVALCLLVFFLAINAKNTSFFFREHRDLRLYMAPHYAIYSAVLTVSDVFKPKVAFKQLGEDAVQSKTYNERVVGILVVGETARADHFSINGYERETTPHIAQHDLVNFTNVESCGTSTAYSLPCMFSFLSEDDFSRKKSENQSNVLDVLSKAGVDVVWMDNNSSCKGVCARVKSENYRENIDDQSEYFEGGTYFDEILADNLESKINASENDVLIVLHPLGSHGPSYYKRYPEEFEVFKPACKATPQTCTLDEVRNSYDNSLLYSDYVLDKTIKRLSTLKNVSNSFMFYVSDHGESLGEKGVYLHGLPKSIAPKSQTHVPMFAWFSKKYQSNTDVNPLKSCVDQPLSHDVLSHTLLSLFHVDSSVKDASLDLFSMTCN